MGKTIYHKGNYIITEEHSKRGYIVINTEGTHENHGHVKTLKVAKTIIDLVERKTVPYSDYLRHTALRLTLDDSYKMDILRKIEKDRDKTQYINVNNDNLKYLKYHKCYKCKWGSFVGDKFVCMFPRCVKRYKNKIRGEKSNGKEKIQQT